MSAAVEASAASSLGPPAVGSTGQIFETNEFWMGSGYSGLSKGVRELYDVSPPQGIFEPSNGKIVEGAFASVLWDIYDSDNDDDVNEQMNVLWEKFKDRADMDTVEFYNSLPQTGPYQAILIDHGVNITDDRLEYNKNGDPNDTDDHPNHLGVLSGAQTYANLIMAEEDKDAGDWYEFSVPIVDNPANRNVYSLRIELVFEGQYGDIDLSVTETNGSLTEYDVGRGGNSASVTFDGLWTDQTYNFKVFAAGYGAMSASGTPTNKGGDYNPNYSLAITGLPVPTQPPGATVPTQPVVASNVVLPLYTSYTPEDKVGPSGFDPEGVAAGDEQRYIDGEGTLSYRIEFWNKEDAIVPTQDAIIIDALDPEVFDVSTLKFTRIGFLNWDIALQGVEEIDTRIDTRPNMNIAVEVKAGLGMEIPGFANNADIDENTLVWWFHAIDPLTGEYPEDPFAGFLPPFNPVTEFEIGWVEFTVEPAEGLTTGTELSNVAYVEFDFAGDIYDHPAPKVDPDVEPAEAAPWINTIDVDTPISSVNSMAATTDYNLLLVNWSGTDVGSGVATYDIYVREDQGEWTRWIRDSVDTIGLYTGQYGHSYAFISVAKDNVGNTEAFPNLADAEIEILAASAAPTISVLTAVVTVDEGSNAQNSGSFEDVDLGDVVTLTSSVGTLVQTGTQEGTWSWSFVTRDGPSETQTVTLTATDVSGATSETTFELVVQNVAPVFEAGENETLQPGVAGVFQRGPIVLTDPGADQWTGRVDFGDGTDEESLTIDQSNKSFNLNHSYTAEGTFTVTLVLEDDDAGSVTDTFQVEVLLHVPPTVDHSPPFEQFAGMQDNFDLAYRAIMFAPHNYFDDFHYDYAIREIEALPTTPDGRPLSLGDDDSERIDLARRSYGEPL